MSIEYVYNTSFSLDNESKVSKWLIKAVEAEGFLLERLCMLFLMTMTLKT